ncbi:hypothetical protein [Aquimarina sp. AU58]|uniref:hypothetical protein n=1 Tax=Aquimarina sp. AU58 TaxID=1874112 RepID=UPI000D65C24B|nr:hypothetical protein [Aquimarina sp. AU58]
METRKMIRRKQLQNNSPTNDQIKKTLTDQSKELLKNPIVQGVAIVGALYGVLFISKYVIREYAEVIAATKKLRDVRKL